MGTGYTRQSAASIITGNVITAAQHNNEFNTLESAFDATTGHSHDGTLGEGPLINLTSSVTGTLPVANGGTGATTLTSGGILLGTGTSAITAMAVLADGSIVIGDGVTNPTTLAAFTSSTGTLRHESGGLEADVSAYSGLIKITGGATSAVTAPTGAIVGTTDAQTLTNKGIDATTNTITNIANAEIKAAAAIAVNKLAALTVSELVVTDASGFLTTATGVSATEAGYLNGVTSAIQTQLDAKQANDATLTSIAALGTAADKMLYTTGIDTWAETGLTAAARTVLDDATVSAMVDTLGGASATGTGGLVRATSPTFVTPILGTPTSGTVTNLTGTASININGTVGATTPTTATFTTATFNTSIELSHATQNTLTASGGVLSVEGNVVPSPASQAANDLLVRGASSWNRLAIGTEGQALVASSTPAPAWANRVTTQTVQLTTSGSSIDFTGIPPSAKIIGIGLQGVSLSGTDRLLIQIGDAGGIETSGYTSASTLMFDTSNTFINTSTAGYIIYTAAAARVASGILWLFNITGNDWVSMHSAGDQGQTKCYTGGGHKQLSATLTQVRLTVTGTDTLDAGQANIFYM